MQTVYFMVTGNRGTLWTDKKEIPAWDFNAPNPYRRSRKQRILTNALEAYHSMLAGVFHVADIELVIHGIEEVEFPDYMVSEGNGQEMMTSKRNMSNQVYRIHSPFFSMDEIVWGEDTNEIAVNHVYVDASTYVNDEEVITCYAMHMKDETQVFDSQAGCSVDAEYAGLQHAVKSATQYARELNTRVIVFADCMPAITRLALNNHENQIFGLGETVFIQWVPGHRGHKGMKIVDNAARDYLRTIM